MNVHSNAPLAPEGRGCMVRAVVDMAAVPTAAGEGIGPTPRLRAGITAVLAEQATSQ